MSETHLHPHYTAPAANAIVGICTVVEHKYGVIATLAKQRAAQAADGLRRKDPAGRFEIIFAGALQQAILRLRHHIHTRRPGLAFRAA